MQTRRERCNILSLTPLLIFFISYSILQQANCITPANIDSQKTLNIVIGGAIPPNGPPDSGDCPDCPQAPAECPEPVPPPPEPECPPPPASPPPPRHPPPPPPSPKHPPPTPPIPTPQPPKPTPTPGGPLPLELQMAIKAIQKFNSTITNDPFHITKTWTGNKICRDKSTYKGFICDTTIQDNKLRVAAVNFNGYHFDVNPVALKTILGSLPNLIVFHANSNNFTGEFQFTPSKLQPLLELDLSNNRLKGEFPKIILTATYLTFLDVRFNSLTGNIPPQVFTLDLDVLYLNNNQFQGNIPDTLGKTSALYLTLASNQLQGSIPKSIGQASNTLLEALLLNNSLSGCLPYEIGLLKKSTLFDASMNKLTGPIPHSFGCLDNMQILNLAHNQLYGTVPELLCALGNLYELTLKFNYFTQVGPECRKLIKSRVLDISMNCILDLPFQRSPEECSVFFSKELSCPDPASMIYVPCKIDSSVSPANRKLLVQPRSYEALKI